MEEKLHCSRAKNRAHNARPRRSPRSRSISSSTSTTTTTSSKNQGRLRRRARDGEVEGLEDGSIECSGKSCRACSATLVADCVALCCCPLAVVSLLVLAFIKVPYVVGRKCLGRNKGKRKPKKDGTDYCGVGENTRSGRGAMERTRDIVFEFGEGEMLEQRKSLCKGLIELDNVLLELYQVGHLGFGRVSFTGIQPNFKGI